MPNWLSFSYMNQKRLETLYWKYIKIVYHRDTKYTHRVRRIYILIYSVVIYFVFSLFYRLKSVRFFYIYMYVYFVVFHCILIWCLFIFSVWNLLIGDEKQRNLVRVFDKGQILKYFELSVVWTFRATKQSWLTKTGY